MLYNDFVKNSIFNVACCDTESMLYYKGKHITNKQLYDIANSNQMKDLRQDISLYTYALSISVGEQNAICENIQEFFNHIAKHKIKTCYFYNAKYDFCIFDYYMLSNSFECVSKITDINQFVSLHSDKGQRYRLEICYKYKNRKHKVVFLDLLNIITGSLEYNLNKFDIRNSKGEKIRKLECQDYQEKTSIDYIIADTQGLYYLMREVQATILRLTDIDIVPNGRKKGILTIGSLAKRELLKSIQPNDFNKLQAYQLKHNHTLEQDMAFRDNKLYRGGLTFINEKYQNRLIDKPIYKYDINSMYPYIMSNIQDIVGKPINLDTLDKLDLSKLEVIINFDYLSLTPRDQNLNIYGFKDIDYNVSFYLDEWQEISEHWYIVNDFKLKNYTVMVKGNNIYKSFVDKYYKLKQEYQKGNPSMYQMIKLILNSSYGKLAQRLVQQNTHREINDKGYISLIADNKVESEKQKMSIFVGAKITSNARVYLLENIRKNGVDNFVYCDTDSIHTLKAFNKKDIDNKKLGAFSFEGKQKYSKYIAPKTYFNMVNNKFNPKCDTVRAKGIQQKYIIDLLQDKTVDKVNDLFASNQKIDCLSGINCKGGKALLPIRKYICKEDNTILLYNDMIENELNNIDNIYVK